MSVDYAAFVLIWEAWKFRPWVRILKLNPLKINDFQGIFCWRWGRGGADTTIASE